MLPTYEKFFGKTAFTAAGTTSFTAVNPNTGLFNLKEGMYVHHFKNVVGQVSALAAEIQRKLEADRQLKMEEGFINQAEKEETVRPLTEQLGSERILRTSTLVPVPEICCTE